VIEDGCSCKDFRDIDKHWIEHRSAAALLLSLDGGAFAEGGLAAGVFFVLTFVLGDGNSIFDFASHQGERLLDVLRVLGRSLQEANAVVVREFLALLGAHDTLALQIALVADEDAGNVVAGVLLNLSHPVLNSAERIAAGDIVGDNNAVGTLVVAGSDGLEALLTGSVPNLQLDRLAVNLVVANLEVNTDGGHEVVSEDIIL
jgi:hypothetical protein